MQSFLAYIASQYGHKKEDVATDALAYLLNRYPSAKKAFTAFVVECGYTAMPQKYTIETRTKGPAGVPDLEVIANQACCAVIENKFWAALTPKQPVEYLNKLNGGLVLFIVPEARQERVWRIVEERCKGSRRVELLFERNFYGRTGNNFLAVTTWESLLAHLEVHAMSECQKPEIKVFLNQLTRVCEVAEQEKIDALRDDEVQDKYVGKRIRDYTSLAISIAKAAQIKGCFDEWPDKKQKRNGNCGEGWAGRFGDIAEYPAWIGLDVVTWSSYGMTPIWLMFEEANDIEALSDIFRVWIQEKRCFEVDSENGGRKLAIPIILRTGVEQDRVVEEAVSRLQQIASLLGEGPG